MYSNILNKFLSEIESKKLRYCFIRNFTAEEITNAPDVDLLIYKSDYKKFRNILIRLGFKQIFSGPFPGHAVFLKDDPDTAKFLNIDLHIDGLIRDGILYYPGHRMLEKRVERSDLFVPSDIAYIVGLILHCIVDKRKFKEEYRDIINSNLKSKNFDHEEFLSEIIRVLPFTGQSLYKYLMARDFQKIISLRSQIILERYLRYPLGLINTFLIYLKRIAKVLNPFWQGGLVVLLGPEGGGKTTYSKNLVSILQESAIRSKRVYMGWHEFILPLQSFLRKTDKKIFTKNEEQNNKINNFNRLREFIIFAIYFVELFLRYMIRIYPYRKLGVIVVTDRYFYDGILMYEHVPEILKKFMMIFIPKPTIGIYLSADPKALFKRKNEVPLRTLEKQYSIYNSNYERFSCQKILNFNKTQKQINAEINNIVFLEVF